MPIHELMKLRWGVAGCQTGPILRGRLRTDVGVVGPLDQGQVGDLVDACSSGDALTPQVRLREEVVALERSALGLGRWIHELRDLELGEEHLGIQQVEGRVVGKERGAVRGSALEFSR